MSFFEIGTESVFEFELVPPELPRFHHFNDLATEIQDAILDYLPAQDFFRLAQVSHVLHSLAIVRIYRTVSLAVHYTFHRVQHLYNEIYLDCWSNRWAQKIYAKQDALARTLLEKPEYGKLVRDLTWTYQQLPLGDDSNTAWKSLETMTDLRSVNLFSSRPPEYVPPLHNATKIQFHGHVSGFLNKASFDSELSDLTTLELDDKYHRGQQTDSKNMRRRGSGYQRIQNTMTSLISKPVTVMQFDGLVGRCPALQRLYIRSFGLGVDCGKKWSPEEDERRFKNWASFIDSTRDTLETLVFELYDASRPYPQPHNWPKNANPGGSENESVLVKRPVNMRFFEFIAPVLVQGPWKRLRILSIKGVVDPGDSLKRSLGTR